MFTIKAYYNEDGKRVGWAIYEGETFIVDVWPTKKQAQAWVKQATK